MPRTDTSKQLWIEKGYEHFALFGPEGISINAMSKEIGLSRASFYNHFGDLDVFVNILLETHLVEVDKFIIEGKESCKKLLPDFYQLMEKYSLGIKCHRQIFLNRSIPLFSFTFSDINQKIDDGFVIDLFIDEYDLNLKREDVQKIWFAITESWYSRIEPNKLTASEMQRIALEIVETILKLSSVSLSSRLG